MNKSIQHARPLGGKSLIRDGQSTSSGGAPVEINVVSCERLARIIKNQSIPLDKEETSLLGFSREEVGNFYLCLVAICHQTSPRGKPPLEGVVRGEHKRGWDYLSVRFEEAFRSNPTFFT